MSNKSNLNQVAGTGAESSVSGELESLGGSQVKLGKADLHHDRSLRLLVAGNGASSIALDLLVDGLREFAFTLAMLVVGIAAAFAFRWMSVWEFEPGSMAVIFLIFAICSGLAALFTRFPRGALYARTRLGLAAFCRTLVPLMALLCAEYYLSPVLHRHYIPAVVGFYAVSLACSVGWTVRQGNRS